MQSSSPRWLADELARSWGRQWPALPDAMEEAAAYVGPSAGDLRRLDVPLAVISASDDAIHPASVAAEWAALAPRAALRTVRLEDFGPHPALLGQACVDALRAIDKTALDVVANGATGQLGQHRDLIQGKGFCLVHASYTRQHYCTCQLS
jgi:pimeloyl-ACP methyl ester carboxylesterase